MDFLLLVPSSGVQGLLQWCRVMFILIPSDTGQKVIVVELT